jgi:hypothetical protein
MLERHRVGALTIVGRAFRLWWSDFMLLILFNIVWFAFQIPIVTGPPATAAMYVIARRLVDGEVTDPRHGWEALRRVALPGLRWGAINLVIVLVVVTNFWAYRDATGTVWIVIRLVWGSVGLGWIVVNLFFWPFWLVQEDHTLRTTLRNSSLFVMKRPGFALTVAFSCLLLIVSGVLVTLPLVTALMGWIALIGVLAVDQEITPTAKEASDQRTVSA